MVFEPAFKILGDFDHAYFLLGLRLDGAGAICYLIAVGEGTLPVGTPDDSYWHLMTVTGSSWQLMTVAVRFAVGPGEPPLITLLPDGIIDP